MQNEYIKTRCNGCMTYFDYNSEDIIEECPYCHTDEFLTDLTIEDINYLKEKGLY